MDHTTDVRRGKLALYESWGFPEVWVEVPDESSPSRPPGLRPGLAIHVSGDRGYRTTPSRPGVPEWTAQEIYEALNEVEISDATTTALRRVGHATLWARRRARDRTMIRCWAPSTWRAGRRVGARRRSLRSCRYSGREAWLVQAAMACRDEADFLRLARESWRR